MTSGDVTSVGLYVRTGIVRGRLFRSHRRGNCSDGGRRFREVLIGGRGKRSEERTRMGLNKNQELGRCKRG